LDHLPFPDVRDFNEDIADKIRQWAEIPPCPTAVLYCFEECLMSFVVNLLLAESETICPLQWTENCSIASSNWPNQFPTFHRFWIVTCDPFSTMLVFHHSRLCSLLSHIAADSNTPWRYRKDYRFYSLTKQNTPRLSQRSIRFGPRNCHCGHGWTRLWNESGDFQCGGALLNDHQLKVVRNSYHTQKFSQARMFYD
jgi:hypothetical protein